VVDGVYTGRSLRALHGRAKAAAVRELAEREGIDLAASTAYSDSETDLPFLEAVGNPVAVNPDRGLARIARERGWQILEFSERAYVHGRRRISPALVGVPVVVGAVACVRSASRPRTLGHSPTTSSTPSAAGSAAMDWHVSSGSHHSTGSTPPRARSGSCPSPATSAGTAAGRSGT
jgi:hypothetical protein